MSETKSSTSVNPTIRDLSTPYIVDPVRRTRNIAQRSRRSYTLIEDCQTNYYEYSEMDIEENWIPDDQLLLFYCYNRYNTLLCNCVSYVRCSTNERSWARIEEEQNCPNKDPSRSNVGPCCSRKRSWCLLCFIYPCFNNIVFQLHKYIAIYGLHLAWFVFLISRGL